MQLFPLSLYPDCDRRSRNRTGSADPAAGVGLTLATGARGLGTLHAITAGEEFRLALRTCAAGAPAAPGIYHIGGDDAELCRIWRRHVETMRRVASVYGRCLSGAERSERAVVEPVLARAGHRASR